MICLRATNASAERATSARPAVAARRYARKDASAAIACSQMYADANLATWAPTALYNANATGTLIVKDQTDSPSAPRVTTTLWWVLKKMF